MAQIGRGNWQICDFKYNLSEQKSVELSIEYKWYLELHLRINNYRELFWILVSSPVEVLPQDEC